MSNQDSDSRTNNNHSKSFAGPNLSQAEQHLRRLLPPAKTPDIFKYKKGRVDTRHTEEVPLPKVPKFSSASSKSVDLHQASNFNQSNLNQPSNFTQSKSQYQTARTQDAGFKEQYKSAPAKTAVHTLKQSSNKSYSGTNKTTSNKSNHSAKKSYQRRSKPCPRKRNTNFRKSDVYQKPVISSRNKAIGIVTKMSEVVIKIDKASTGIKSGEHLEESLNYISRNGDVEAEDENGMVLTKAEMRSRAEEWCAAQDIPDQEEENTRRAADARRLIVSFPPGSDPDTVKEIAHQFGQEFFKDNGFQYISAMHCHDEQHSNEPEHPHVHFVIKAVNDEGKRLNVRKNDLKHMRERLAEICLEHGMAMNATSRAVRGVSSKSKNIERIYNESRTSALGEKARKHQYQAQRDQELINSVKQNQEIPDHEYIQKAKRTRSKIKQQASATCDALSKSEKREDQLLAKGLKAHFDSLNEVQSEQQRRREALKKIIADAKSKKSKAQEQATQSQAQKWAIHRKKQAQAKRNQELER